MIEIDKQRFIASGVFCEVYEHPNHLDECIKLPTENSRAQKRLKADLGYYATLHKKKADLSHIANYLGKCETSLGIGYRYQCVRDSDASISNTLEHYMQQEGADKERVYGLLRELAEYLVKQQILISDIHSRNILMQQSSDGALKLVIVDGIGDRVGIPILNIFPKLVVSKIIRRWNRFSRKELESNALLDED